MSSGLAGGMVSNSPDKFMTKVEDHLQPDL